MIFSNHANLLYFFCQEEWTLQYIFYPASFRKKKKDFLWKFYFPSSLIPTTRMHNLFASNFVKRKRERNFFIQKITRTPSQNFKIFSFCLHFSALCQKKNPRKFLCFQVDGNFARFIWVRSSRYFFFLFLLRFSDRKEAFAFNPFYVISILKKCNSILCFFPSLFLSLLSEKRKYFSATIIDYFFLFF